MVSVRGIVVGVVSVVCVCEFVSSESACACLCACVHIGCKREKVCVACIGSECVHKPRARLDLPLPLLISLIRVAGVIGFIAFIKRINARLCVHL